MLIYHEKGLIAHLFPASVHEIRFRNNTGYGSLLKEDSVLSIFIRQTLNSEQLCRRKREAG